MNRVSRAFSGTYPTPFAEVVVECESMFSILLGQNNCHIRTEDPTPTACAILYPEALFVAEDWTFCTPSTSLVILRIAGFNDIARYRDLVVLLTHPTFASLTALSIATLFRSPTLPGYLSRTSLVTVSTATIPVALTAAAMVGIL